MGPLQRTFVAWPFVTEVRQTRTLLLFIARTGMTLFILPKRCVDAASLDRMLAAIGSRVGRGTTGAFDVVPGEPIPVAELASPR